MTAKKKLHILDMKIRTWSPTDKDDPCIAKIGWLPMFFTGKTPMQAHIAADNFRKAETEKVAERDANARRRLEERKAAKDA